MKSGLTFEESDEKCVVVCLECIKKDYVVRQAENIEIVLQYTKSLQKLTEYNKELDLKNKQLELKMNHLERRITDLKDNLKQEILNEMKIEESPNNADNCMNHSISNDIPTVEASNSSMTEEDIMNIIREQKERENRKLNLCIHGLPELGDDRNNIRRICSDNLNLSAEDISKIVSTRRIGAFNISKARNTIVTLNCAATRARILSNSFKLKDGDNVASKVFVTPDFTRLQQKLNYELRKEVRERVKNGENITLKRNRIIYRNISPSASASHTPICRHTPICPLPSSALPEA